MSGRAGAATTARGIDPSRVITEALRPFTKRVRRSRVVILVAYLASYVAASLVFEPAPLWLVLGITVLGVVAAIKGVFLLLPREVRALLPRLRRIRARQDRWLRQLIGLTWRSDPAIVLARLAALDPEKLSATDRLEIVALARVRNDVEMAARFDPPPADDEPADVHALRALADVFGSIESDPSGAIGRIDAFDVSALDPALRERWEDSVGLAHAWAAAVRGEDVVAALADAWAIPHRS
jgi:hypothetical protein